MIRATEALLLASTKLKTRKVRLVITIIVTSLLFAVLAFVAGVADGTIQSLKSFQNEGYGGRFLVQATPLVYSFGGPGGDKEVIDHFEQQQAKLVADKKAAAKKLGINYDEKNDQSLPLFVTPSGPNGVTEKYPNPQSRLVADYYRQKNAAIPGTDYASFSKLVGSVGAVKAYRGFSPNSMFGTGTPANVSVIINGQEDLSVLEGRKGFSPNNTVGVASIQTLGWRNIDSGLLQPFMLRGQTAVTGKDGSVPIVAPYSAAQEILGLKKLPDTATSQQKLERLTAVRQGVAGKTAQLCYRNAASASLLSRALQQKKDIEANKNNKDYTKPALLYAIPAVPCGETTVQSDKRTADEKKAEANQQAFDKQFGAFEEPVQGLVTVRIIGINPDIDFSGAFSPATILMSILISNAGSGWISPSKAVADNTLATAIQGGTAETDDRSKSVYYAEFTSLASLKSFIESQQCENLQQIHGPPGTTVAFDTSGGSQTAACIAQKKVFTVAPYGNSAAAVEQIRAGIWKVMKYVILAIVLIAALVMMGNIGKIIADSRRETAVFRALGAKRLDITQIYVTYTIIVSVAVGVSGILIGSLGALWLSHRYSPELSVSAVLAYNAQDVSKEFSLFGLSPLYSAAIVLLAIAAGLLSALLPLLANTRRNPIRDMRDDT
jgi:hypothetical protein